MARKHLLLERMRQMSYTGSTAPLMDNATQTSIGKTFTTPVITSPTGLVKADVGLGNVDNTSDATKNAAVAALTNKTATLAAGTASVAPLTLTSGTNLTVAVPGALEYDGSVLYATSATGRGVLPGRLVARIDTPRNLADDGTDQAIFPSTGDALTLVAGATYQFEGKYYFTKGVNNISVWVSFGGNATYTSISYNGIGLIAASNGGGTPFMNNNEGVAGNVRMTVASAAVGVFIRLWGECEVNAAGTIIPTMALSAASGSTPTVNLGTFFSIWQIGANPVTTIGPWA